LRPCPICSADRGEILHSQRFELPEGHPLPRGYDVVSCRACGFAFADTPASQADYDRYYAGMSKYADTATSTGAGDAPWDAVRLTDTAAAVAAFGAHPGERIADIGCANGGMVAALLAAGFGNACGIDPSPDCVAQARARCGANFWVGTLADPPDGAGPFDGVLLSHVMEHVRDLRGAMAQVAALLVEGGWDYLEVPDASRYADFLVAPFQDFNTEHINHFSPEGLGNLLRVSGFAPVSGGRKTIFSAKDMPYPAVYQFGRKTGNCLPPQPDVGLAPALQTYVERSAALMERIDGRIRALAAAHGELVVWGAGQLTLKLLAESSLGTARIAAFVDGNPVHRGRKIRGIPVVAGSDLPPSSTPILVASLINAGAIRATIAALGLTNPVFGLLEDAG
jgi:SAM-dependent methyltransferase